MEQEQQPQVVQELEPRTLLEQIREEAASRIMKEHPERRWGLVELYEAIIEKGLVVWLEYWPMICEELRALNHEKQKLAMELSQKGKFTDTYGWSESHLFRASWEYTPEFYFFMKNYVYTDFFESSETKTRERFMKDLMSGQADYVEMLMKLKTKYGSNSQDTPVVHGGERGSSA